LGLVFYLEGIQRKPYQGGGDRNSAQQNGDFLTLEEICGRVAEMVAEILAVLHGMDFKTIMDMYWEELSFWHEKAVNVSRTMYGGK
jgi:hypothetical protein